MYVSGRQTAPDKTYWGIEVICFDSRDSGRHLASFGSSRGYVKKIVLGRCVMQVVGVGNGGTSGELRL